MAKQGQHENDHHDQTKSKGPNNPSQSQTITTGTYKKPETVKQQAAEGKDPHKQAQAAKNEWKDDPSDGPSRIDLGGGRGSLRQGPADHAQGFSPEAGPGGQHPEEYRRDLNPDPYGGQNRGVLTEHTGMSSAYDVKDLNRELPNLTDDELKQISVVQEGDRLEQGAVYFDLNDPARGEFKARGDMVAEAGSRLVPKSLVDYQLWNALIGVDNPERLGFADDGATTSGGRR